MLDPTLGAEIEEGELADGAAGADAADEAEGGVGLGAGAGAGVNAADERGATSMPEAEANIGTIRDQQKDFMSLQSGDQNVKKCKVTDKEGLSARSIQGFLRFGQKKSGIRLFTREVDELGLSSIRSQHPSPGPADRSIAHILQRSLDGLAIEPKVLRMARAVALRGSQQRQTSVDVPVQHSFKRHICASG